MRRLTQAPRLRTRNRGSAGQDAFDRWLIFSNGKEKSAFWPWGEHTRIELPSFEWPRVWDYAGVIREIRYASDKCMPENPSGDNEEYIHDFLPEEIRKRPQVYKARRLEPFVEVFTPRGECQFAEPATLDEIARKAVYRGEPRFPKEIAFLGQCDGWSLCPPGVRCPCGPSKAVEAEVKGCILCCSPEGDMLVVLDGLRRWKVAAVMVGPKLTVGRDGISDGEDPH